MIGTKIALYNQSIDVSPLLSWPHPILRQVAHPLQRFDDQVHIFKNRLLERMYQAGGVGLAAPQLGIPIAVFVMDCRIRSPHSQIYFCANPELELGKDQILSEEGCLSFPGLKVSVPRATEVLLTAQNASGTWYKTKLAGLDAICAQHEYEHLQGLSFINNIDYLDQKNILKKYQKKLIQTMDTSDPKSQTELQSTLNSLNELLLNKYDL